LVRGNPPTSLDPDPKSFFDFGSINGCQEYCLHLSNKRRIIIGMEISEFILET
jgi:hypothetical protein